MPNVSNKTVGRLSLYRRLLTSLLAKGERNVYSHLLAELAGVTAAQVRRDIMALGYTGSPSHGYDIEKLQAHIDRFLDPAEAEAVALIGVGNLGRAILAYFAGRRPKLKITAAFDKDAYKCNRVIHGTRCYPPERLEEVIRENGISIAVIAVPAQSAQAVADKLIAAGVRGILNFAPLPLRLPPDVHVEDIDMTMSLDKVAFFARQSNPDD